MSRPSLTPNEDAVRAMELPESVSSRMEAPGAAGTEARIYAEVMRAYGLAVAREMDRGVSAADIASAVPGASAGIIASASVGFGGAENAHVLGRSLLHEASSLLVVMIGDHLSGRTGSVTVPIEPVHRV